MSSSHVPLSSSRALGGCPGRAHSDPSLPASAFATRERFPAFSRGWNLRRSHGMSSVTADEWLNHSRLPSFLPALVRAPQTLPRFGRILSSLHEAFSEARGGGGFRPRSCVTWEDTRFPLGHPVKGAWLLLSRLLPKCGRSRGRPSTPCLHVCPNYPCTSISPQTRILLRLHTPPSPDLPPGSAQVSQRRLSPPALPGGTRLHGPGPPWPRRRR